MPPTTEDDDRLAERLMTGEAWDDYCDRLKAVGRRMLETDFPGSPRERAEGFRHLVRVAVMGLQWGVECNDREFPIFYRQDDDINKWGGPNVDNLYLRARIDGASTYKVTANVSTVHDAILSIQNGDMHEGNAGVSGDLDRAALDVEADGSVEVTLSPEPAPEGVRNWIQLPPDADHVCVRQFFYDWDEETPAQFHIVKLGNEGAAPRPLTPTRMANYLDQAANWVETSIPYWNDHMARGAARLEPNVLGPPLPTTGTASQIHIGRGRFDLAPGEALLIELEPPEAHYWCFQWYTFGWYESPDFANRQTSVNGAQAVVDSDGRVRIVICDEDPGVPNWIDTTGLREGSIIYRYVSSRTEPPVPASRVVMLQDLRSHLPSDTPVVEAEARRELIERRRLHVEKRFRR